MPSWRSVYICHKDVKGRPTRSGTAQNKPRSRTLTLSGWDSLSARSCSFVVVVALKELYQQQCTLAGKGFIYLVHGEL